MQLPYLSKQKGLRKQYWPTWDATESGPEFIKLFSCSTQLSMKFVLLINLKLLTIANSSLLNIAEHETFSAYKYENANYLLAEKISCSAELSTKKKKKSFITSAPDEGLYCWRANILK